MTWLLSVLPLGLLSLGFPFFLVLLATATAVLLLFGTVPPAALHQTLYSSIDKFALLAVIGPPLAAINASAMGARGKRIPTVAVPAVTCAGMRSDAGTTIVSGPGQKRAVSWANSSEEPAMQACAISSESFVVSIAVSSANSYRPISFGCASRTFSNRASNPRSASASAFTPSATSTFRFNASSVTVSAASTIFVYCSSRS